LHNGGITDDRIGIYNECFGGSPQCNGISISVEE